MSIGCLMLDIQGTTLNEEEVEMLAHPLTGGVILFSRNFHNQAQIQELCSSIRHSATGQILIAVDQEGGRVQRFHEEFSPIPAMGSFQHLDLKDPELLNMIATIGWLMSAELLASGIDISFAPVLDVDIKLSKVIGDRGFSDQPKKIIEYASAFIKGMSNAGMSSTGKHFPGHGSTIADSHFDLPIDDRSMEEIRKFDLSVFAQLSQKGLSAVMPAHVVYSNVDPLPACFSPYWLQTILRKEINFKGAAFSDDLSMAGAKSMGDIQSRAEQALSAGCDMILCCNDKQATIQLLDRLKQIKASDKNTRILSMMSKQQSYNFQQLKSQPIWKNAQEMLELQDML